MKTFTSFAFMMTCCWAFTAQAQEQQKNVLKFGLSGMIGLEAQFEYERAFKKGNGSFQIEVAAGIPHKLPKIYTNAFLDLGTDNAFSLYDIQEFSKNSKTAFSVIPEVRLYPLRKFALRGFYVAPYAKWKMHLINMTALYKSYHMIDYGDYTSPNAELKMTGTMMTVGAGLGLGYQFIFKNGFTLDLGAGLGFDYHILNTKMTSQDPDETDAGMEMLRERMEGALSDIPVYGKAFKETTVSGKTIQSKGGMPFLGVRPVLSLGYAFR